MNSKDLDTNKNLELKPGSAVSSHSISTAEVESGYSPSYSEADIRKMKMKLETLDDELSLYSKEYTAATTTEEKSSIRAAMTVKKTRFNNLNSELDAALRSGKSNIKY